MRKIVRTSAFKADMKRLSKSGRYAVSALLDLIQALARDESLAEKNHDHPLLGKWKVFRECHIQPDWLLIYQKTKDRLVLVRTGTHSDLFG